MTVPTNPNPDIYHILHLDKLSSVLADGKLFSDEGMESHGGSGTVIGMTSIKAARKHRPVGTGAAHGFVGQYVPFYFCPRSVMLYMIHVKSNQLEYKGGQEQIVHLVSDFNTATIWANENNRLWAFTDVNAAAGYAGFYYDKSQLDQLKWELIPRLNWNSEEVKGPKQAEFLLKDTVSWHLIKEIGVFDLAMKREVEALIANEVHKPLVTVRKEWYY